MQYKIAMYKFNFHQPKGSSLVGSTPYRICIENYDVDTTI